MCYIVKKGTTKKLILVHARTAADPSLPAPGLSHATAAATAASYREGNSGVHRIALSAGRLGEHAPGGFVEVDAELMPGVYQLGVPDEVFAPGSDHAVLVLRFPGAEIDPIDIALVAYDAQDESRLGMTALGPEGRIAALRGAFPRLTALELREREALGAPS